MSDMTEQDAARLAELAQDAAWSVAEPGFQPNARWGDVRFLLRLLDAKPAGEFVTKATHDDLSGRYDRARLDNVHISTKLGAAEARAAELEAESATQEAALSCLRQMVAQAGIVRAERDRLAASLAAAEAERDEARRERGMYLMALRELQGQPT